jgi:hypothetical protein
LFFLRAVLRRFGALGQGSADGTYVDRAWGFEFVSEPAPGFGSPVELGDGVTRFPGASCPLGTVADCAEFVDVIRLSDVSPLRLTLPDGRSVGLEIGPESNGYARLARAWEKHVGTSIGSEAVVIQGVFVFTVTNEDLSAMFVRRGDRWLVILATRAVDQGTGLMEEFLRGFSFLPEPALE